MRHVVEHLLHLLVVLAGVGVAVGRHLDVGRCGGDCVNAALAGHINVAALAAARAAAARGGGSVRSGRRRGTLLEHPREREHAQVDGREDGEVARQLGERAHRGDRLVARLAELHVHRREQLARALVAHLVHHLGQRDDGRGAELVEAVALDDRAGVGDEVAHCGGWGGGGEGRGAISGARRRLACGCVAAVCVDTSADRAPLATLLRRRRAAAPRKYLGGEMRMAACGYSTTAPSRTPSSCTPRR